MPTTHQKKEFAFFPLFERFIMDSVRGRRLQPNGKRITSGTIANYRCTFKLLVKFSTETGFQLRLRSVRRLTARELATERNYWRKFYKKFSSYLYDSLGYYDNYVGHCFKNIKVFFSYLNKEHTLMTGDFHKYFYIRKEEIAIFPLMPEELNFLIYNEPFAQSLTPRMREVKDFFVFGCTVALRISDLLALNHSNIRVTNGTHYLAVRSIKTGTDSLVKLPPYAVAILAKYKTKRNRLLPAFNKVNLNQYIKQLLELAGMTASVQVRRERRGRPTSTFQGNLRFCDIASTHTMRRTAITTMLCLGMNEQVVRRISGHAPTSKEFYRYVVWAQTYQDHESEQMFERLKGRVSEAVRAI